MHRQDIFLDIPSIAIVTALQSCPLMGPSTAMPATENRNEDQ